MTEEQTVPEQELEVEETQETGEEKADIDINVEELVQADIVEISQGGANQVQAKEVNITQGGAYSVQTDTMHVSQGGVLKADTQKLEITEGGVGLVETQDAVLNASGSIAVFAKGNVNIDRGGVQAVFAEGDITMNQSGVVLQVADKVTMGENNSTVFLFAKSVEGEVHSQFGQRESALFGIMAGISTGMVLLIGLLLGRRRKK